MMKWMTFILSAVVVVGLVGCGEKDKKEKENKGESTGSGDKKLTVKISDFSISKGKKKDDKVTITREKFDDEVTISFDLPKGVKVLDKEMTIEKGKTEKTFTFEATDEATEGKQKGKVTAKSGDMEAKNVEFTITVEK